MSNQIPEFRLVTLDRKIADVEKSLAELDSLAEPKREVVLNRRLAALRKSRRQLAGAAARLILARFESHDA